MGFQFPNQLQYVPSPLQHRSCSHFNIWHCPCYQSPLSFIGFISISDVQSILYFILYKADQYPTSRKIQRPPLPGLVIYDALIGLFFLPRRVFVSQAVLHRDTTLLSPHPGQFISLPFLPKLYQQLMQGDKHQNPHPKHRVGIFKRENVAVA